MTTINAAAAWRTKTPVTLALISVVFSVALAGCETASSLLGSTGDTPTSTALNSTTPAAAPNAATSSSKVAIAPVIGAPDGIAKQLQAKLGTALQSKNIAVSATAADKPQYTLRGYVVSAREKTNTKVSYIWDVTDPTGKRVNRITGEELLPAGKGRDPWASVGATTVDKIASKTAGSLATWLPTQQSNKAATTTPAATPIAAAAKTTRSAAASTAKPGQPAATGQTTGSISRAGSINAIVPSVTGAPGDGSVALRTAIQRELKRSGVTLTQKASASTYRVEGEVKVGQGKDGQQPIQIDWNVKDPKGKKIGTVSQNNKIPQGSLDGAWGKTADAAASAAVQGIIKLLPN